MKHDRLTMGTMVRALMSCGSLFVSALLIQVTMAWAGGGSCCCHCGCQDHVQKVCRVVCDTKEVKHTKYKVLCEDYCLAKVGHYCGCEYIPDCGHVRTRKKLVKFEEVERVPINKCVVEYLCPHCSKEVDAVPYEEPGKPVPHTAQLPEHLSRLVRPIPVPPVELAPNDGAHITR